MRAVPRLDAVVYDLEIERMVPVPDEPHEPDVAYCEGWHDHAGMGIAVLCAKDLFADRSYVFLRDNIDDFIDLVMSRSHLVSFNGLSFDDKVVAACTGHVVTTTYDLKVEAQGVIGGRRVPGRRLDDYIRVNLGRSKPLADHRLLPAMWQRGERGAVITECLSDVELTAELVRRLPQLIDPVTGREFTLRALDDTTQFTLPITQPARLDGDRHGDAS